MYNKTIIAIVFLNKSNNNILHLHLNHYKPIAIILNPNLNNNNKYNK